ncbi:MAG: hypothetical protein WAK69_17920 [Rhodoplanes sp.]
MRDAWQYQLRIYLPDELVETARFRSNDPALGQLLQILQKHSATMKSQFDAFAEYVAEAEREGTEQYPLYQWTIATIEDPAKKEKRKRGKSRGSQAVAQRCLTIAGKYGTSGWFGTSRREPR